MTHEDSDFRLLATPMTSLPADANLEKTYAYISYLRSCHIYVIVSGNSGAGTANEVYDILDPLFQKLGVNVIVHKTDSETSHDAFLRSQTYSAYCDNIFIVIGGDTMIYNIVNSMARSSLTSAHRVRLSVIPCGTANALMMSLGITSIPLAVSRLFQLSEVSNQNIPVMKISITEGDHVRTYWGLTVCSWGLHASLVGDADDPEMRRKYGPSRFAVRSHENCINNRLLLNDYYILPLMYITVK
jgi:diacylglycerol kinase family enzyme